MPRKDLVNIYKPNFWDLKYFINNIKEDSFSQEDFLYFVKEYCSFSGCYELREFPSKGDSIFHLKKISDSLTSKPFAIINSKLRYPKEFKSLCDLIQQKVVLLGSDELIGDFEKGSLVKLSKNRYYMKY